MTAGRKNKINMQDWCTPKEYVYLIRSFFGGNIELDPCANKDAFVKADIEFHKEEIDGLSTEWKAKTIFVNPPYGRSDDGTSIYDWLARCNQTHREQQAEIIALVPVATHTKHWKDHVFGQATAEAFIKEPRVKFYTIDNPDNKGASMACAFVYWGKRYEYFADIMSAIANTTKVK